MQHKIYTFVFVGSFRPSLSQIMDYIHGSGLTGVTTTCTKDIFEAVTSSLFGPNILLVRFLSYTFSSYSSLCVRENVWHPYRTTSKITALYILISYSFRQESRRQNVHDWMVQSIARIQLQLNFSLTLISICYSLIWDTVSYKATRGIAY
jgi:hypothetical protein